MGPVFYVSLTPAACFRLLRHAMRPAQAASKPGRPAPTRGPGTGAIGVRSRTVTDVENFPPRPAYVKQVIGPPNRIHHLSKAFSSKRLHGLQNMDSTCPRSDKL